MKKAVNCKLLQIVRCKLVLIEWHDGQSWQKKWQRSTENIERSFEMHDLACYLLARFLTINGWPMTFTEWSVIPFSYRHDGLNMDIVHIQKFCRFETGTVLFQWSVITFMCSALVYKIQGPSHWCFSEVDSHCEPCFSLAFKAAQTTFGFSLNFVVGLVAPG